LHAQLSPVARRHPEYYRQWVSAHARSARLRELNPHGFVSQICQRAARFLGRDAGDVAPYISSGQLILCWEHVSVSRSTEGDRVLASRARLEGGAKEFVRICPYFLDATELGDVLELAGVEQ
jgi:hypothetical protein